LRMDIMWPTGSHGMNLAYEAAPERLNADVSMFLAILHHLAAQGVSFEIGLWHEYEAATFNRRAIEWSRGLKAGFNLEEFTDEELAQADVDGHVFIPAVTKAQYALLVGNKAECTFLELGEAGGGVAAHEFLLRLQNERDREEEQRNE